MIDHVYLLNKEDALREVDRARQQMRIPKLDNADLRATALHGLDLSGADLNEANLSDANLRNVYMRSLLI